MDSQNLTSTKIDVYELVTNRIIELLEAGTVPWQKPWTGAGIPMNVISKRPYRGINLWLLLSLTYERNLFLTWDQLKKIGGSVNQGQHGHIVVFWKNVKKNPEELDDKGNPKVVPMLRYYKVFNVEQCRDIPPLLIPELIKKDLVNIIVLWTHYDSIALEIVEFLCTCRVSLLDTEIEIDLLTFPLLLEKDDEFLPID